MNKIINRNTWILAVTLSFVSCNKERLQNEKIDPFGNSANKSRHRNEDYLHHEDPPTIFTKILHDGIITLPRQPIVDRVEAIQNFLKLNGIDEVGIALDDNLNNPNMFCGEITLNNPTLGSFIKYTCDNLKIYAQFSDGKIVISDL